MYRTSGGEELGLSLKTLWTIALRRFWTIVMVMVVTVGLAMLLSILQTPQYEASVRILVGQDRGITASPTEAVGLQQLTQTMAVAADSRPVAQAVINRLNLDMTTEDFFENLNVEQVSTTQFIEISYTSPDPREAQRIADVTGEAFSQKISEVSDGAAPITAVLYERAELPDEPVSPDFFRNGVLSLVLGAMLGAVAAFLLELVDDRWNSPEEAENVLNLPVFGVIPVFEPATGHDVEKTRTLLRESHPKRKAGTEAEREVSPDERDVPSLEGSDAVSVRPASGGVTRLVKTMMLDPEGRVKQADAGLLGLLGYDEVDGPKEMPSKSLLEGERAKEAGLDRCFQQSLNSRSETATPPFSVRPAASGSAGEAAESGDLWLRAVIRPVADEDGSVREVEVVFVDLDERGGDYKRDGDPTFPGSNGSQKRLSQKEGRTEEKEAEWSGGNRLRLEEKLREKETDLLQSQADLAVKDKESKELRAKVDATEKEKRDVERRLLRIQQKLETLLLNGNRRVSP